MTHGSLLEALRASHVRCTPQRYAILDFLQRSAAHPTAEEIHRAINADTPQASLATVYKVLHALVVAGLVREVVLSGDAVRYESHTDRHHHFICDQCREIQDCDWFDIPGLAESGRLGGRTLGSYELVMRGRCERCRPVS